MNNKEIDPEKIEMVHKTWKIGMAQAMKKMPAREQFISRWEKQELFENEDFLLWELEMWK